jgi:YVTN family beta-propeller protein
VSNNGRYVYVSNHANGAVVASTVSVIDTTTNTVTKTITIPDNDGHNYGSALAVSADGSRLYVVNRADQFTSVVNTATNTVISTTAVGYSDGDVAITPDGRLYIGGYNGYAVIDTATMTVIDTVDLWPDNTYGLALSQDGTRAYATAINIDDGGSYSSLVVIDTATNSQIAKIYDPRGDFQPYETVWSDVAVSPDGTRAYVSTLDGKTITVIDTATNTIVDSFITAQDAPGHWGNTQYITVGPDGTLYISDGTEGTVYAVTVGDNPLDL